MVLLLIVSLITLFIFPGLGIAGLVSWGLLTLLFKVGDEGNEQMAKEIQNGNTGNGGCWLVSTMIFVRLGGLVIILVFGTLALEMKGF